MLLFMIVIPAIIFLSVWTMIAIREYKNSPKLKKHMHPDRKKDYY